jgi:hypothetical protein
MNLSAVYALHGALLLLGTAGSKCHPVAVAALVLSMPWVWVTVWRSRR